MARIELNGMKFFAYHGVYPEERLTGAEYLLDVAIEADVEEAGEEDDLSKTINYEVVHQICKGIMKKPVDLLETILIELKKELQIHFQKMNSLQIKISKLNPPLTGVVQSASLEESWEYVTECGRCTKDTICYDDETCWCNSIHVSTATLARINEQFGTQCLCPKCLSDYAVIEEEDLT